MPLTKEQEAEADQIRLMPGRIMEVISGVKRTCHSRKAILNKFYLILHFAARVRDMEEDMRKTYTISLKINFNDDSRHDDAMEMMREAAREVYAKATLIADGRQPQVAFQTEDYFEGVDDKALLTDQDKADAGL